MIFVHDRGRMANNMLQYGHVYAWGREHGRQTMSMRFAYKYPYFHICDTAHHNFATYVYAKYGAKWGLIPTIRFDEKDKDYHQEEEQMTRCRQVMVTGWEARWYDLFLKYKPEILSLFAFHDDIERRVAMQIGEACGLNLGVHIRRGDYATFYDGRFFFSDEQYVRIIRRFLDLYPQEKVNVFICGNDPKLQREYYQQQLSECRVTFPDGNPGEDLCLFSHCDYLIGAPSTFSLAAAMYHDTPLYWIMDADAPLTASSFGHFDELFRHIL